MCVAKVNTLCRPPQVHWHGYWKRYPFLHKKLERCLFLQVICALSPGRFRSYYESNAIIYYSYSLVERVWTPSMSVATYDEELLGDLTCSLVIKLKVSVNITPKPRATGFTTDMTVILKFVDLKLVSDSFHGFKFTIWAMFQIQRSSWWNWTF